MIIKVDHFFIFHKMLELIYVLNMLHNDVSFQNNAYTYTKDIQKLCKKFIIFLFLLIFFLLVQWIVKLNYGNFIMNDDVFEHTLDIVKLYAMLILIIQERNFFQLHMIKRLNYGIQKLVGNECFQWNISMKFSCIRSSEKSIFNEENSLLYFI
jgi:hypothetical protein